MSGLRSAIGTLWVRPEGGDDAQLPSLLGLFHLLPALASTHTPPSLLITLEVFLDLQWKSRSFHH